MDKCPDCGTEYERVGAHLSASGCSYPELSSHQFDVLTGILLGDGDVERRDTKRPKFRVRSTERDFLEHVYSVMEPHSCSITLNSTSEYASEKYGGDVENYSDSYQFRTISSPVFRPFAEWYEGSKKHFPEELELNYEVFRYWYVCDGSLHPNGNIHMYAANEYDRAEELTEAIRALGLECSLFKSEREDGRKDVCIQLSVDSTNHLLEATDPVPGYEYKWTERFK